MREKATTGLLKTIAGVILIIAIGGFAVFGLSSCGGQKYKLVFDGRGSSFENAKSSYRAGQTVTLYFPNIATDTDYSFFVDGEAFNADYDEKNGYVISFTMPAHDVTVGYTSRNSMEYDPGAQAETMLIDFYYAVTGTDGGDSYRELVLYEYEGSKLKLSVFSGSAEGEETRADYSVPYDAFDECSEVIKKYKMAKWSKMKDLTAIDGAVYVCNFTDEDGNSVRVSSDDMPEDGIKAFGSVEAALAKYIIEDNRIG